MAPNLGDVPWTRPVAPNLGDVPWTRTVAPNLGGVPWARTVAPNLGDVPWTRTVAPNLGGVPWTRTVAPNLGDVPWTRTLAPNRGCRAVGANPGNEAWTPFRAGGTVDLNPGANRGRPTVLEVPWTLPWIPKIALSAAAACQNAHPSGTKNSHF